MCNRLYNVVRSVISLPLFHHCFISILQREAQIDLSFDHAPPILLTEVYPVTIRVKNNEEKEIKNIL